MKKLHQSSHPFILRFLPYLVFFMSCSFCVYEFALRVMPSAMVNQLMHSFNLQAAGLGFLASLFFYGYTPMQIPVGLMFDAFGARTLLTLTTLLCAVSSLLFGIAHSTFLLGVSRFLMGFTASYAFIGAMIIAAKWFAPERFAMFTGLVQSLGCLGAIIGEAPIAHMVHSFGWRQTAILLFYLGIVLTALIWLIVRNKPYNKAAKEATTEENPNLKGVMPGLKQVLKQGQTWWIGVAAFACWAPMAVFATLWGPTFLSTAYNISIAKASGLTSVVWIAIAIGSPLAGWLSNRIGRRCLPTTLCAIIGLVSSLLLIYGGTFSRPALIAILFCFGFSASSQVVTFGMVLDINPTKVIGTASGFNNMAVVFGGILLQPLVGWLLHAEWLKHPTMNGSTPIYNMPEFHIALFSIPMCFVIGIIASAFFIKETHCVAQH